MPRPGSTPDETHISKKSMTRWTKWLNFQSFEANGSWISVHFHFWGKIAPGGTHSIALSPPPPPTHPTPPPINTHTHSQGQSPTAANAFKMILTSMEHSLTTLIYPIHIFKFKCTRTNHGETPRSEDHVTCSYMCIFCMEKVDPSYLGHHLTKFNIQYIKIHHISSCMTKCPYPWVPVFTQPSNPTHTIRPLHFIHKNWKLKTQRTIHVRFIYVIRMS